MKRASLETLAPLLAELRDNPALEEIRLAEFLLDGQPFLHFHEDDDGVTADVLLTKRRVSLPVSTAGQQAELLDQVYQALSVLESRELDRRRRRRMRTADEDQRA